MHIAILGFINCYGKEIYKYKDYWDKYSIKNELCLTCAIFSDNYDKEIYFLDNFYCATCNKNHIKMQNIKNTKTEIKQNFAYP